MIILNTQLYQIEVHKLINAYFKMINDSNFQNSVSISTQSIRLDSEDITNCNGLNIILNDYNFEL